MDKPIPETVRELVDEWRAKARLCVDTDPGVQAAGAALECCADDIATAITAAQQQGLTESWQDEWRSAVAAKLSSYGLSEEAAAVFAESELGEYRAGLCDCAENDPADMVDLMMGVALDAIEKWKAESAGRPFGYKRTAPPSAPVGVKTLSEFMAEQEALHPGIHDKVQAAADELRASLAQQPAAVDGSDAQAAEIEALRAEVEEWKDAARCASEQQDSLFREARALNERADKLEEALREVLIDLERSQANMRNAAKTDPRWEGCADAIQPRVDTARALLRDQEEGE